MSILEQYNSQHGEAPRKVTQVLEEGGEKPGLVIQFTVKVSGGQLRLKQVKYVLGGVSAILIFGSAYLFRASLVPPSKPPPGFEGNIPNTPEYKPPPTPTEVQ